MLPGMSDKNDAAATCAGADGRNVQKGWGLRREDSLRPRGNRAPITRQRCPPLGSIFCFQSSSRTRVLPLFPNGAIADHLGSVSAPNFPRSQRCATPCRFLSGCPSPPDAELGERRANPEAARDSRLEGPRRRHPVHVSR